MTSEGFLRRLGAGRAVNCVYRQADLTGLISAWANDGRFVLTWEECRAGDQYNENSHSRDERHLFDTAEDLLAFVEERGYSAFAFSP